NTPSIGRTRQNLHDADHVDAAHRHGDIAVPGRHHMAYNAATIGDLPRLEFLRLGVEPYQIVRPRVRFHVPDLVVDHRHAVGLCLRSAGAFPFRDLAGLGFEPGEPSGAPVAVPDHVVGSDAHAADPGA